MAAIKKSNRYELIIEQVFLLHYKKGDKKVAFSREELLQAAKKAGMQIPKNIGDLVYSFRYRNELPETIKQKAPPGRERWASYRVKEALPARRPFANVKRRASTIREPDPRLKRFPGLRLRANDTPLAFGISSFHGQVNRSRQALLLLRDRQQAGASSCHRVS